MITLQIRSRVVHAKSVWTTVGAGAYIAAMPPFGLWFLLPLAFAVQWGLIARAGTPWRAAGWVWLQFFAAFAIGLHWITAALLVDFARDWIYLPFAVAGLPAVLALFPALGAWVIASVAPLVLRGRPWLHLGMFAATWVTIEWMRSSLFSGFPWLLSAHGLLGQAGLAQLAWLMGPWAMALLVALFGGALGLGLAAHRRTYAPLIVMTVVLAFAWGAGELRLRSAGTAGAADAPIVRVLHSNVPQAERWATADQARHFRQLADATLRAGAEPVDLVIWPEMSVPTFLDRDRDARTGIAALLPAGAALLAGGPRAEQGQTDRLFYNTAFLLGGDGTIQDQYDKVHLVPFGEYVPFGQLLPLHIIGDVHLGYAAGETRSVFSVSPDLRVRPLICYEIGFTYLYVPARDEPTPTLLVNISNDAWFGGSIGPAQHFALARFRAIESGLPVARAVNAGISAVLDPYGRVLAQAEGDPAQGFDVAVPPPISNQRDWIVWRHFSERVLIVLTFAAMVGSISIRWVWCR